MSHLPTLGGPCGPPIPFPTAASSHLRIAGFRPRPIAHGTISQHISILYNGPEVEVLCPRSGSRLAAWSFAIDDERRSGVKSSRDENDVFGTAATEVTCVAFLEHKIRPGLTNARRFVVVGTSNGIVGVIDIKSSQLIRVVKFQHRVTSVTIVKNGSKTSSDPGASTSRFFPDELQAFEGIIAVGTQEGRLYLLVSVTPVFPIHHILIPFNIIAELILLNFHLLKYIFFSSVLFGPSVFIFRRKLFLFLGSLWLYVSFEAVAKLEHMAFCHPNLYQFKIQIMAVKFKDLDRIFSTWNVLNTCKIYLTFDRTLQLICQTATKMKKIQLCLISSPNDRNSPIWQSFDLPFIRGENGCALN